MLGVQFQPWLLHSAIMSFKCASLRENPQEEEEDVPKPASHNHYREAHKVDNKTDIRSFMQPLDLLCLSILVYQLYSELYRNSLPVTNWLWPVTLICC